MHYLSLILFLLAPVTIFATPYKLGLYEIRVAQSYPFSVSVLKDGRDLWKSVEGQHLFLTGARTTEVSDERGHYEISDEFQNECFPKTLKPRLSSQELILEGELQSKSSGENCGNYRVTFRVDQNQQLGFMIQSDDSKHNFVTLISSSHKKESFYGFGVQSSYIDLKGHKVPILVQEQGIGRGASLGVLSWLLKFMGVEGTPYNSYISAPFYLTSDLKGFFLSNSQFGSIDMRDNDKTEVYIHSGKMEGTILDGRTPTELIKAYTNYTGRMKPLPQWLNRGAILGLQGGNDGF